MAKEKYVLLSQIEELEKRLQKQNHMNDEQKAEIARNMDKMAEEKQKILNKDSI